MSKCLQTEFEFSLPPLSLSLSLSGHDLVAAHSCILILSPGEGKKTRETSMENELEKNSKHMKTSMEINIPSQTEIPSLTSPPPSGSTGLARQGSITKNNNCLCSPTNHAGSFRCRLHRTLSPTASALTGLQRTKSIDSSASSLKDSHSNKANDTSSHETSASAGEAP